MSINLTVATSQALVNSSCMKPDFTDEMTRV